MLSGRCFILLFYSFAYHDPQNWSLGELLFKLFFGTAVYHIYFSCYSYVVLYSIPFVAQVNAVYGKV